MAITVSASFITQYGDEVTQLSQQKPSKLIDTVRTHRDVTGSAYNFQKLGSVTANTKARGADITGLEPLHTQVTATLADYYAGIYIEKMDQLKTNVDLRKEYVDAGASAINRAIDDVIVSALALGTNTITTAAGGWTYAKHMEALTKLASADVDEEDRYFIFSPNQLSAILSEVKMISGDYALAQLEPLWKGGTAEVFGATAIMSTRLPYSAGVRTCFYYNKKAVGLAIGQAPTTMIDWVPQKVSHLTNTTVSLGAVIVDPAGLVALPMTGAAE